MTRRRRPAERDPQQLAGNTIEKTMDNAILDPTYPRLVRFALNGATSATVSVLRTEPSAPPLPTHDIIPPAHPRIATGLPSDTAALRATFDHVPRDALHTTCGAYSPPIPGTAPTCV